MPETKIYRHAQHSKTLLTGIIFLDQTDTHPSCATKIAKRKRFKIPLKIWMES
tara:strand:- start:2142 stop:2300 length:159 start_codon:yes stop_codon:yes gene_type:complete